MAYQVLARKYRPQLFSDVIGQDHVTRTLKNAIAQHRIAHGYIFSGHRGIGKTTIARILAMALNCQGPDPAHPATGPQTEPCGVCDSCKEIRAGNSVDVIEIDAATNRGIDEIRELRDAARYRPARDRFKIYILDEAHQITDAAFNALLKTLEEPPSHIVFMMATTAPEDIPQTIRSRCQHYSFHAVKFNDIVGQLKAISQHEGIDAEEEAVSMVAEAGDGSMRDALSIMDQAIASGDFSSEAGRIRLTADQIRGLVGNVSSEVLEHFMESVSKGSSVEVLTLLDKLMTEGQSPTHFARQFVRYLRNVLVAKIAGASSDVLQISSDERARAGRTAALFTEEDLTRYLNIMLRTFDDIGYKQEQRFHLELGLLKLVHAQRMIPLEQFLSSQPAPSRGAGSLPVVPSTGQPDTRRPSGTSPSSLGTDARTMAVDPRTAGVDPRIQAGETGPGTRGASAPAVTRPSPFESDTSRKSAAPAVNPATNPFDRKKSEMSAPSQFGSMTSGFATGTAVALAEESEEIGAEPVVSPTPEILREEITQHLTSSGQQGLAETLSEGEWSIVDGELRVQVALPASAVNVILTPEIKRGLTQSLAGFANGGRALKFNVVSGLSAPVKNAPALAGSAKSRAADDPLVQYFQQKFNAEIRTVLDQTKS